MKNSHVSFVGEDKTKITYLGQSYLLVSYGWGQLITAEEMMYSRSVLSWGKLGGGGGGETHYI